MRGHARTSTVGFGTGVPDEGFAAASSGTAATSTANTDSRIFIVLFQSRRRF
jgi:tetrahydromethanopterin S-methyltransferase subunit C